MATELEKLLIKIEADTLQMRQALRDAERSVDKYDKATSRSFDRASKNANAHGDVFAGAFKKAGGAVAAYLTVAKGLEALNATAELDRDAKAAGLTAAQFQELAYAVSTIGVEYSQLIGIAGQFASNLGELRTRTGGLHDFLQRHNKVLLDNLLATKSTSEAYDVYANAVAALTQAEEKTILVAKGFGEEGRKLTEVFDTGAEGMGKLREEARKLGVVLDEDTLAAAKRTSAEFNKLSYQLSTYFKQAVVGAADALRGLFAEGRDDWLYTWATSTMPIATASMDDLKRMTELLELRIKYLQKTTGQTEEVEALTMRLMELRDAFNAAGGAADQASAPLKGAIGLPSRLTQKAQVPDWGEATLDFTAADKMAEIERRRLAAVGETTALIRAEYEGELEQFRRMLADKKISEDDFLKARDALNAIAGQKVSEQFRKEAEQLAELSNLIEASLMQPLEDAFNGGVQSAEKYFVTMLQGFAKLLTQALIIKPLVESITSSVSTSGLGNLLGLGGIAGARADGGPVSAGKPYLVGERGPEIVVPRSAGQVLPNGAGGGTTNVYQIDARGADISVAQRIERALAASERNRKEPVSTVAGFQRRFPMRAA